MILLKEQNHIYLDRLDILIMESRLMPSMLGCSRKINLIKNIRGKG